MDRNPQSQLKMLEKQFIDNTKIPDEKLNAFRSEIMDRMNLRLTNQTLSKRQKHRKT